MGKRARWPLSSGYLCLASGFFPSAAHCLPPAPCGILPAFRYARATGAGNDTGGSSMAGTPGYGPWPPYNASATPEAQRAQLEAMLRALREQRPTVLAEIGDYLYSLVMQQQMRDPVVINAFRRLYDHDQQIQQAEAGLHSLSVSYPPVSQPP